MSALPNRGSCDRSRLQQVHSQFRLSRFLLPKSHIINNCKLRESQQNKSCGEKNTMDMHQSNTVTEEAVYEALKECYDPEIPVDLVNLGLIYGVTIVDNWVGVKMTLTSPGCPASNMISQH